MHTLNTLFNRAFRAFYYRFLFGRRFPGSLAIERHVSVFEKTQGTRDTPAAKDHWESEYAGGFWDYLEEPDEAARYSAIIAYLSSLKPMASVLDVGCGGGVLFHRYRPYGYSRYTGIDISERAIDRLSPLQDDKTSFIAADAECYAPEVGSFDAIVFNECLYYFHDPIGVALRYSRFLAKEGIMITSTYPHSRRAKAILKHLKARFTLLDETETRRRELTWICSVFVPRNSSTRSRAST